MKEGPARRAPGVEERSRRDPEAARDGEEVLRYSGMVKRVGRPEHPS